MDLFRWKDDYSVGVAEFDNDHRRLLSLANSVVSGAVRGLSTQEVSEVFDELAIYADRHFSREEDLMRRAEYPGLTEHREEHRRLLSEVRLLKSRFIADDLPADELAVLLVDWVVVHIQRTDQQYRGHLNDRGFH